MPTEIHLAHGYGTVILPDGPFPAISESVSALLDGSPTDFKRAVRRYSAEAVILDADGIALRPSVFAVDRWLKGGAVEPLQVDADTADIFGYLRARVVFDRPGDYAPERREHDRCDSCAIGWRPRPARRSSGIAPAGSPGGGPT